MNFLNYIVFIDLICIATGLFMAVLIIKLLFKAGALMDSIRMRNESMTNAIDTLSDMLEKMQAEKK